jgi:hypothetical protein
MQHVEEMAGVGEVSWQGRRVHPVRYSIARYQQLLPGNGLPIPGLHRIEGTLVFEPSLEVAPLVGEALTLLLDDGRTLGVTLADETGRVLAEGHGPMRCLCC